jgi:hypothetical protein
VSAFDGACEPGENVLAKDTLFVTDQNGAVARMDARVSVRVITAFHFDVETVHEVTVVAATVRQQLYLEQGDGTFNP